MSNLTNLYTATFSGATFSVNLPAPGDLTNGYFAEIMWTNTSGGTQIGTIQVATVTTSLVREELSVLGVPTLVSSVTNGITGAGTLRFYTANGVWSRVTSSGDAVGVPTSLYDEIVFARGVTSTDGTGCTFVVPTTTAPGDTFQGRFSATAATNVNYCSYMGYVPLNLDTNTALTANVSIVLQGGADTAQQKYVMGVSCAGNSTSATGTFGNFILWNFTDAAGATGDIEYVDNIALTGWNSILVPGRQFIVLLERDGAGDASTVVSETRTLSIKYKKITP